MRRGIKVLVLLLTALSFVHAEPKARVVATTDGEDDDKCSMVRFLYYANEMDIEGIVYTNSQFHGNGNGTTWIQDLIEAYGEIHANLIKHDPDYPTKAALLDKVKVGNLSDSGTDAIGDSKDTEGSDIIVEALLKDDPRPVWLLAWGGANTIGQAIYRIATSHADKYDEVIAKTRIYFVFDQEVQSNGSTLQWLKANHSGIQMVLAEDQVVYIAYTDWKNSIGVNLPPETDYYFSAEWFSEHVLNNHGPLGSKYIWPYLESEGDSPSYFHTMRTGLRNRENPGWGGWGGRFVRQENDFWINTEDDGDLQKPMYRWFIDLQNDWAARLDWGVTSTFGGANHHPVAELAHPDDIRVRPGDDVHLSAAGSSDPDGDELSYTWWQYKEAGSYSGSVDIVGATSQDASFVAPDVNGEDVHIVLEVQDNGTPPLKRYRRVIVTIDDSVVPVDRALVTPASTALPGVRLVRGRGMLSRLEINASSAYTARVVDSRGRSHARFSGSVGTASFAWPAGAAAGSYAVVVETAAGRTAVPLVVGER